MADCDLWEQLVLEKEGIPSENVILCRSVRIIDIYAFEMYLFAIFVGDNLTTAYCVKHVEVQRKRQKLRKGIGYYEYENLV